MLTVTQLVLIFVVLGVAGTLNHTLQSMIATFSPVGSEMPIDVSALDSNEQNRMKLAMIRCSEHAGPVHFLQSQLIHPTLFVSSLHDLTF